MKQIYKVKVAVEVLVFASSESEAIETAKSEGDAEWQNGHFHTFGPLKKDSLVSVGLLQSIPYGADSNETAFKLFLETADK